MELIKMHASETSSSPRREFRFSRLSGKNQKAVSSNILEAIAQFSGGEAVTTDQNGRLKIMVKKEDLKHVLEAIGGCRGSVRTRVSTAASPGFSLEQRLNFMRRRQILRAANSQVKGGRRNGAWRPVLQSIPEEF